MPDFFISYNQADKSWAEWIAWVLEENGRTVVIQAWDFRPGGNFVLDMQRGATGCERTIAVLSEDYLKSEFTQPEWAAALVLDPQGIERKLLPIRVQSCEPQGLLKPIVYVDFVGKSEKDAENALLAALEPRAKPAARPGFPGDASPTSERSFPSRVRFPGTVFQIPHARNDYFTGRDDVLTSLHDALVKSGRAGLTQALAGLGGIGKTQTAIEYAYRHRDEYGAVLWVQADDVTGLISSYGRIASDLGLPVPTDAPPDVVREAVKAWLTASDGITYLLILDNADDPGIVHEYLPANPAGHILITSRSQQLGSLHLPRPTIVRELPEDKSLDFLLVRGYRQSADDTERTAARELAVELGGLPLALEQAAAYVAEMPSRYDSYLASFRKRKLELLGSHAPVIGDEHKNVATTWSLNIGEVAKDAPAAADLLTAASFLAPDRIPDEIFIVGAPDLGHNLATALADAKDDPELLTGILSRLTRYSLVQRDPDTRTFDMHRLVQAVVCGRLDEPDRRLWEDRAVQVVSAALPAVEFTFENRTLGEALLPHALAVIAYVERRDLETPEVGHILNQTRSILYSHGRFQEALPLAERALAVRENVLGPGHPDTVTSLYKLDTIYRAQLGPFGPPDDELILHSRSFANRARVLGPEHPDTAASMHEMATVQERQERLDEAVALYERARIIREKVLGPEHPDTVASICAIAHVKEYQGRCDEAIQLYDRAMIIREKVLGPEDPQTTVVLKSLANLYWILGRFDMVVPLYERALASIEKMSGSENTAILTILSRLGGIYMSWRRYEEALWLYGRMLAIYERLFEPESPATYTDSALRAASFYELEALLAHFGQALPLCQHSPPVQEEAVVISIRALRIYGKAAGPDSPNTAACVNNLARLYQILGRFDDALPLYASALTVFEKALGPEHPATLTSLNLLAGLYQAQGRYDNALPILETLLAIYEKTQGLEQPEAAVCLSNLGSLYQILGRFDEALPLYLRALTAFEKAFGSEHPASVASLNMLANLYCNLGRHADAEPLYVRALTTIKNALGPDDPNTATSLDNLATLYYAEQRYTEAEPLFVRSLEIREHALGSEHPLTTGSFDNCANVFDVLSRHDEALAMRERAEAGRIAHSARNSSDAGAP